jgi:hypothetical protein
MGIILEKAKSDRTHCRNTTSSKLEIPTRFIYEARTILITNELPKNLNSTLISSRCLNFEFNPNNHQLLTMMYEIAKQEKMNTSLSVHHIDYNKYNSIPQNCISLCFDCHAKTNFNRKYWISFFQNKLTDCYGYKYSDKGEIILKYV